MTESTTAATSTGTAKHTASPSGLPNFGIPKFDLPNMVVPEAYRELADKSVAQAKENFEKCQAAGEEMTAIVEETCSTAAKSVTEYNLKLFEMARTNANAAFEYAHALLGKASPSEFVELTAAHARKQFETMTAQTKELTELAQKVATDIAKPINIGAAKAFDSKSASS
jgi:phasin